MIGQLGAPGICCDALNARRLVTRKSDPIKWSRSVYYPTDLGFAVAAALRARTEEEKR